MNSYLNAWICICIEVKLVSRTVRLTDLYRKDAPMQHFASDRPVKLKYADLNRMQIVGSRTHLKDLIARGTIRPPHKDGTSRQAAAWWFYDEIMEDMERLRTSLSGQRPSPQS